MTLPEVHVGFDPRERAAYEVCVRSLQSRTQSTLEVYPIVEAHLRGLGLYCREHQRREGWLWDVISEAPMSTEFALTRFLTPVISRSEWAIYCDCDFLWRADVVELARMADPRYAVMVVKHHYEPPEAVKMDGQVQLGYPRKNWSSLVLWNCRHPAHRPLRQLVNAWPGRRLHAFEWLEDGMIGEVPEPWNWLEGHSDPQMLPKAVHYTRGTPDLPGYDGVAYDEWWRARSGDKPVLDDGEPAYAAERL